MHYTAWISVAISIIVSKLLKQQCYTSANFESTLEKNVLKLADLPNAALPSAWQKINNYNKWRHYSPKTCILA